MNNRKRGHQSEQEEWSPRRIERLNNITLGIKVNPSTLLGTPMHSILSIRTDPDSLSAANISQFCQGAVIGYQKLRTKLS